MTEENLGFRESYLTLPDKFMGIDVGMEGWCIIISDDMNVIEQFPAPTIKVKTTGKRMYNGKAIAEFIKKWAGKLAMVAIEKPPDYVVTTEKPKHTVVDRIIEELQFEDTKENKFKTVVEKLLRLQKELLKPRPKMIPTLSMQRGYTFWIGCMSYAGIRFQPVDSKTWQRALLKDTPGTNNKQRSIITVQQLLPSINLLPTPRTQKPNDNIADAGMLAIYARWLFKGDLK